MGIYISVHTSMILLIRGRQAAIWSSLYLDSFGEEDRDLKRGKPLFLSKDRFDMLSRLWASCDALNSLRWEIMM